VNLERYPRKRKPAITQPCHPHADERCRVDLYALGILLIEIASWGPIESAQKQAQNRSVTDFRAFLLSEFVESGFLAYRMGTDYQNAVKHCLQVSFENEDQDSANILGSFYGNVVQGLTPFLS
jgi:hypothetical protein